MAGKTVLITGASAGIGAAAAAAFVAAGARVMLAARRADRLAALEAASPGLAPAALVQQLQESVALVQQAAQQAQQAATQVSNWSRGRERRGG